MFRNFKDINFREIDRQFCVIEGISIETKNLLNRAGFSIPEEDD